MTRCRQLLADTAPEGSSELPDSPEPPAESDQAEFTCPHCGSERVKLIESTAKRSWRELFWRESDTCPWWYAERQREDHRRFWTAAYGEDFSDWYLETQVESAKESEPPPPPPRQLHLFGMTPTVQFEIESY